MIETTMRHVIDDTVPGDMRGHYLYLVRNEDVIFYVGASTDPIDRIHQHLDMPHASFASARWGMTILGRLITSHQPESDAWKVVFFTLADLKLIDVAPDLIRHFMGIAEQALIMAYQPCLNSYQRSYQVGLPEEYQRRMEAFYHA